MSNPNIGSIDCPFCHQPAHVREYTQRKKLDTKKGGAPRYAGLKYIHCPNGCGRITTANQAFIDANATLFEAPATETPPPPPPPPPVGVDPLPEPPPEPAPVEQPDAPKKKSILDGWL